MFLKLDKSQTGIKSTPLVLVSMLKREREGAKKSNEK